LDTETAYQYVYLDFDGERTTYRNRDLNLSISVTVRNSGFSDAQKQTILSQLTAKYKADGVVFTLEKPQDVAYSTLYFGESGAFKNYGSFFGVSETIDGNNQTANDNAFILMGSAYSTDQVISVAARELDNLLGNSITLDRTAELRDYAANTCLLSTEWNQYDPYNQYCPVDSKTKERSLTGCTNTAAAQIIFYWIENGLLDLSLTLDESDSYTKNGITVSSDSKDVSKYKYLSFSETNSYLSNFRINSNKCIAALNFAAGVVQQASYSSESTSTVWNTDLFIRSGFQEGLRYYYSNPRYFRRNQGGLTDAGVTLLVNELLDGRPVGASLKYGNGKKEGEARHAVIIDGYNSSTNEFHLNFGWGGKDNGWYSLDSLNNDYVIDEMIMGLTPVVSPCLTVSKLTLKANTVNWEDDVILNFRISNEGTSKSKASTAYIYCEETLLESISVDFVSAGSSRNFTCTLDASRLPVGSSSLTVQVYSQDATGSVSSLSRTVKVYDDAVTDADDTWKKAKAEETWKTVLEYDPAGQATETVIAADEYVGYYDYRDFREVTIACAGKYTFTLSGVEKELELKLYSLTEKGSLKALKSRTVTGSKGSGALVDVPLERGTYYVSVMAVNWEAHGDSKYTLSVSGEGFVKGDNQDDWTDLKTAGDDGSIPFAGVVTGETEDLVADGWVGLGDEVDYRKITLETAAKLSFSLAAGDAAKFTVSTLVETIGKKGVVTYSLKKLQATELRKAKDSDAYTAETAPLLLESGDYYISMQSLNAAKGGYADYSVRIGETKKFFLDCDDGWNNWLYDAKAKRTNGDVCGAEAVVVGRGAGSIRPDKEIPAGADGKGNFVGFGDETDFVKIRLETDAKLSFTLNGTKAAKLLVYKLTFNKNGDVAGAKLLQTTSFKLPKDAAEYAASTAAKLLESGEYYVAVQASNAAKDEEVYYNLDVSASSLFFDSADGGANGWLFDKKAKAYNDDANLVVNDIAASGTQAVQLDVSAAGLDGFGNFVGYQDAADYAKIVLADGGALSFRLTFTADATFALYRKGADRKGNPALETLGTLKLKLDAGASSGSASMDALSLEAGEYYISMTAKKTTANEKGSVFYNVEATFAAAVGDSRLESAACGLADAVRDDTAAAAWRNLETLA